MKVNESIRKIREIKGFSQEFMALKLGLKSIKTYSNIENGNTDLTMDRLEKIAEILEISLSTILGFEDRIVFESCEQNYCNIASKQEFNNLELVKHLQQEIEWLREQLKLKLNKN